MMRTKRKILSALLALALVAAPLTVGANSAPADTSDTLESGVYLIYNEVTGHYLNAGTYPADPVMNGKNPETATRWNVSRNTDGAYRISVYQNYQLGILAQSTVNSKPILSTNSAIQKYNLTMKALGSDIYEIQFTPDRAWRCGSRS